MHLVEDIPLVVRAGPGPVEAQAVELPVQEGVGLEYHEAENEEIENLNVKKSLIYRVIVLDALGIQLHSGKNMRI